MEVALLGRCGRAFAPGGARGGVDAGRECREDRIEVANDVWLAADHEAEPTVEAEHAAAGADVHVVDVPLREPLGPGDVVSVVGVAAVDDDVAGRKDRRQLVDGRVDEGGRHHDPCHARRLERRRQLLQRVNGHRTVGSQCVGGGVINVVDDAVVAIAEEATHEVGAHPSEADHPNLHARSLAHEAAAPTAATFLAMQPSSVAHEAEKASAP